MAINCAAFPETLLETELFGYEEGAFTGSRRGGRPGLFESAHLGTVFLDEVGDAAGHAPDRASCACSRRGRCSAWAATTRPPVDVRVVAATHRDLRRAWPTGQFRDRPLLPAPHPPAPPPALRERPEDIAAIATSLLRRALARHGALGAHARALASVLPRLEAYSWPGNVRELENVLERVALLFSGEAPADQLQGRLGRILPELYEPPPAAVLPGLALRQQREAQEVAEIRRVVAECGGNVSRAARRMGLGRSTIYRKLAEPVP